MIAEGFDLGRDEALKFLEQFKQSAENILTDREMLVCVARSSLRTKLVPTIADSMSESVVDAVRCIKRENEALDLHMVEIMHMRHKLVTDTQLIKGLVLDHGARHP